MKTIKLEKDQSTLTVNLWDNVDSDSIKTGDAVQIIACEVLGSTVLTSSPSTKIKVNMQSAAKHHVHVTVAGY